MPRSPFSVRRSAPLAVGSLTALCCAIYFVSYLTRKTYDASILAICEDLGLARSAAGIASTAAVALYGSGPFVTGFLADRFDPRRIILLALLTTAGCNAAMPAVAGSVPAMAALWALNGFAQAMFWPPLVKILVDNCPPAAYRSAVFAINAVANIAIIATFVLVSGCVRIASWRWSFGFVAAASIYGFAAIRERLSGWRPVFGLWIAVLAAAVDLCLVASRRGACGARRGVR